MGRSSIVLHLFTFIAFAIAVFICSYIALLLDTYFQDGGAIRTLINTDFIERLANDSEADLEVDVLKDKLQMFNTWSWGGIHLIHFLSGLTMVGISGFLTMGFFWFPFLDGRNNRGGGAPILVVIVVVGAVRVFLGIYRFFKDFSARLLQSAEVMILEVGVSADVCFPPPPPPSAAQPTVSASASIDTTAAAST